MDDLGDTADDAAEPTSEVEAETPEQTDDADSPLLEDDATGGEDEAADLVNEVSTDLGLETAPEVSYADLPEGQWGGYNRSRNSIEISNSATLPENRESLEDTVAHELRHAYQHQESEKFISGGAADLHASEWADNFDNYKDFYQLLAETGDRNEAFTEYSEQPIEADAFGYEKEFRSRTR